MSLEHPPAARMVALAHPMKAVRKCLSRHCANITGHGRVSGCSQSIHPAAISPRPVAHKGPIHFFSASHDGLRAHNTSSNPSKDTVRSEFSHSFPHAFLHSLHICCAPAVLGVGSFLRIYLERQAETGVTSIMVEEA